MHGRMIFLLSIHNDSGVPERGCYIVLRCTQAAGNDHFGPYCLQDSTEYCRFRFYMQADAYSKPGERLRLAKLLSQSLKELLMEFCPANLLDTLLHKMIMGCALCLFTGHGSRLSLQVDWVMPAVFERPPSRADALPYHAAFCIVKRRGPQPNPALFNFLSTRHHVKIKANK